MGIKSRNIWFENESGTIGVNESATGSQTIAFSFGNGGTYSKNVADVERMFLAMAAILDPSKDGKARMVAIIAKARACADSDAYPDIVCDRDKRPSGEAVSRLSRLLAAKRPSGDVDPFA